MAKKNEDLLAKIQGKTVKKDTKNKGNVQTTVYWDEKTERMFNDIQNYFSDTLGIKGKRTETLRILIKQYHAMQKLGDKD